MRAAFFFILALALTPSLPAFAQRGQGLMPLDQILSEIRRSRPGQFYDADGPSPGPDGSQHYHLKWMTPDGRIEWLDTDARTGRVLNSSPGRDSFDAGPPRNYPPAPSYPAPDNRSRFREDDGQDWGGGRDFPRGYPQSGGFPGGGDRDYGNRGFEGRDFGRGRGRGRERER